jgi:hypothetical protein
MLNTVMRLETQSCGLISKRKDTYVPLSKQYLPLESVALVTDLAKSLKYNLKSMKSKRMCFNKMHAHKIDRQVNRTTVR